MTLQEAIALLMGHANRQEVVDLLQKEAQPLTQVFFNRGHGVATEESKTKVETSEARVTQLQADLQKTQQKIDELQNDKPDIAALQTQHQRELLEQKESLTKQLDAERANTRKVMLDRDLGTIQSKLVEKKVKGPWAKVLLQDQELRDRIKYEDSGNPVVFQPGTKTPYSVADGQSVFDLLADEIVAKVPTEGIEPDDTDTGSESNGDRSKGNSTNAFDRIRDKTKQELESRAANKKLSARDRLKGNRSSA